jgi:hypothetical protein
VEAAQSRSSALKIGIVLLTLATAGIHLFLALRAAPDMMTVIPFTLNFVGYIALLAALYLPLPFARTHRKLVRYAFIAYTVVTIVLWVALGMANPVPYIGYIDKAIEVLLVILLLFERP